MRGVRVWDRPGRRMHASSNRETECSSASGCSKLSSACNDPATGFFIVLGEHQYILASIVGASGHRVSRRRRRHCHQSAAENQNMPTTASSGEANEVHSVRFTLAAAVVECVVSFLLLLSTILLIIVGAAPLLAGVSAGVHGLPHQPVPPTTEFVGNASSTRVSLLVSSGLLLLLIGVWITLHAQNQDQKMPPEEEWARIAVSPTRRRDPSRTIGTPKRLFPRDSHDADDESEDSDLEHIMGSRSSSVASIASTERGTPERGGDDRRMTHDIGTWEHDGGAHRGHAGGHGWHGGRGRASRLSPLALRAGSPERMSRIVTFRESAHALL